MKALRELRELKVSLLDLVAAAGLGIFTVLTAVMVCQQIISGQFLK